MRKAAWTGAKMTSNNRSQVCAAPVGLAHLSLLRQGSAAYDYTYVGLPLEMHHIVLRRECNAMPVTYASSAKRHVHGIAPELISYVTRAVLVCRSQVFTPVFPVISIMCSTQQ